MGGRHITVVTGSRSDFGILYPVIKALQALHGVSCRLAVTGGHLAASQGRTIGEIMSLGLAADAAVPMCMDGDDNRQIAASMGMGVIGFAEEFERSRPGIVLILGDRYEIFAAAAAAAAMNVPIAHIGGGETDWATNMDGNIRNAITKMAHIHFVCAERYKQRVLNMLEEPWRVFLTGSPSLDGIKENLMTRQALEENLGFAFSGEILLITYLIVGLREKESLAELDELLAALSTFKSAALVFTSSNADPAGRHINSRIAAFCEGHANAKFVGSLGRQRYLSMLNLCDAVVGNSSSGIIEAPSFQVGTVNVGIRQAGRIRAASIIDVPGERNAIISGVQKALYDENFRDGLKKTANPFGGGNSAAQIARILRDIPTGQKLMEKKLYDK